MSPLTSRLSAWLLAAGVAALLGGGFSAQTTRELFPNTDDRGRAAVAYEDDALQIVAAYYYSQRHHDSRWVLIELAVSAAAPTLMDLPLGVQLLVDGEPVAWSGYALPLGAKRM